MERPTLPSPEGKGDLRRCADPPISLITFFAQAVEVDRLEAAEVAAQRGGGRVGRKAIVVLRTARWLGNDFVRQAEPLEVGGGELQRLGRLHLAGDIAPEDGGAG